jgi:hypothetical protein
MGQWARILTRENRLSGAVFDSFLANENSDHWLHTELNILGAPLQRHPHQHQQEQEVIKRASCREDRTRAMKNMVVVDTSNSEQTYQLRYLDTPTPPNTNSTIWFHPVPIHDMSLNSINPMLGLMGGSLIGLSAATLLLFNGDILGASGLMSSFVIAPMRTLSDPSQQWKLAFLASFCFTTRLYLRMVDSDALKDEMLGGLPIVSSWVVLCWELRRLSLQFPKLTLNLNQSLFRLGFVIGGFCVGFGTKVSILLIISEELIVDMWLSGTSHHSISLA